MGEVTNPKITQKKNKNNLIQHLNTPTLLKRGYKCKGREKVTLPLPKVQLQLYWNHPSVP
jgi:hypothetical protein